jgi:hypothetical protein
VIEFEGLKPRKPVYIAPFITGGVGQVNKLNEAGTRYEMNSTPSWMPAVILNTALQTTWPSTLPSILILHRSKQMTR